MYCCVLTTKKGVIKMFKKLLISALLKLFEWAFDRIYNFIDKNGDDVLDKEELMIVYERLLNKFDWVEELFERKEI